jgi:ADP-ribosylglycohydrolase
MVSSRAHAGTFYFSKSEENPGMSASDPSSQNKLCLLGAVSGDVIGSAYEFKSQKKYDFPLFSTESSIADDGILTLAVADAILSQRSYGESIRQYARRYPDPMGGYGMRFQEWARAGNPQPYNSFGNGSAMRISAVGWAFDSLQEVLSEVKRSAEVTHNHPEGIKGAQVVALSVFLARTGSGKEAIKQEAASRYGYDLDRTLDVIRPAYSFNESCQETVPQAIIAFLESEDYEDAIRKAISLGGDADTLAAITGAIAEAYYGGVPMEIVTKVR